MFVTIVISALIVTGLFGAAGLIPSARPTRADIFGSIKVDYKLFTNILGVAIFTALFALTMRRGASDPMCGMKVDRANAVRMDFGGETFYFCSDHCAHAFEISPHDAGVGPGDAGVGPGDAGVGPGDAGVGSGDTGVGPGDAGDPIGQRRSA
jgi:YHS domain-containing protein